MIISMSVCSLKLNKALWYLHLTLASLCALMTLSFYLCAHVDNHNVALHF